MGAVMARTRRVSGLKQLDPRNQVPDAGLGPPEEPVQEEGVGFGRLSGRGCRATQCRRTGERGSPTPAGLHPARCPLQAGRDSPGAQVRVRWETTPAPNHPES